MSVQRESVKDFFVGCRTAGLRIVAGCLFFATKYDSSGIRSVRKRKLPTLLQRRYGYTREKAEMEIDLFLSNMKPEV